MQNLDKVIAYLKQVEEWGHFEVFLVLCVSRSMSFEQLEAHQKRVLDYTNSERKNIFLSSCLISAILDATFKQLRSDNWKKVGNVLELFEPILYTENNFLLLTEILFLRFQESLYQIRMGDEKARLDILDIFNMVSHFHFSPKVYPNWFEQYGKIINLSEG